MIWLSSEPEPGDPRRAVGDWELDVSSATSYWASDGQEALLLCAEIHPSHHKSRRKSVAVAMPRIVVDA